MAGLARLFLGILLLPACWGVARASADAVVVVADEVGGITAESLALLGGMAAFALCWAAVPHPVKTYVLGHELTHALWGLLFLARPTDVQVTDEGGSVRLSKSNLLITLAPYFFPFYTFVVVVVALVTSAFIRPLPWLPLWMFMIGFTWAFHILFTVETLAQRQPDIRLYGRIFSWTFIFIANILLVLVFLAVATPLTFVRLGGLLAARVLSAYVSTAGAFSEAFSWIAARCTRT